MVADRVDVISRRAGSDEAWRWSSDGKGAYSIGPAAAADAPKRGTRVVLHLMDDAKSYTERYTLERMVKAQSGHVPVPISIVEKPGAEARRIGRRHGAVDQAAIGDQARGIHRFLPQRRRAYDEPALTIHYRAEGRQEFTRSPSCRARGRSTCSTRTARAA